ncbi:MAG: tRNA 2-thiouridine(34) synthase MnmA [Firmicutes bacterium HGW-Firmicutes-21]|nr:MAG: tRNA 2-thiouridine(34) synthase MnmA [Firmicutes bacterium HGW-Firmicutes-21]
MQKSVIAAMSGGVDSSVAAFLLAKEGYRVMGATMKLFENQDIGVSKEHPCCSLEDIDDARSVAVKIGIPYFVFNFTDSFRAEVIDRFVKAYESGATPNPCIDCNRHMKFEKMLRRADELEVDYIATGHYARIETDSASGRHLLRKSADIEKDQTYVLCFLTQEQLKRTLFPLGGLKKEEVRSIAEQNGFINADKHDSQDICFVQNRDYAAFIEFYTGKTYPSGNFTDKNGSILGTHKGIIRYTIGQRKGLGLALPEPMYVCGKDTERNTVTLCTKDEMSAREVFASDINLIAVDKIDKPMRLKARTRYNQKEQPATAEQIGDNRLHIEFDSPQSPAAKGQAVVLYDGDIVIGGGVVE